MLGCPASVIRLQHCEVRTDQTKGACATQENCSSDRDLEQPHFLCLEEKPVAVDLREATVDFG